MQSKLNVRAVQEMPIAGGVYQAFAEYIENDKEDILRNSRAFLEPVISSNNKIVKWVIPHDTKSVVKETREFKFGDQVLKIRGNKSYYIETSNTGESKKVEVFLPDYQSIETFEIMQAFHELGKLLEPLDIMYRSITPELRDIYLVSKKDGTGLSDCGEALAEQYYGRPMDNTTADPTLDYPMVSSVKRLLHGLTVANHVRKAELYRELLNIIKNKSINEGLKSDDNLSKLGLDPVNVNVEPGANVDPENRILGVSYERPGYNPRVTPQTDARVLRPFFEREKFSTPAGSTNAAPRFKTKK